jgi:restriction endonuclease Mrr
VSDSPREFEELVAELLRREGYQTELTGRCEAIHPSRRASSGGAMTTSSVVARVSPT